MEEYRVQGDDADSRKLGHLVVAKHSDGISTPRWQPPPKLVGMYLNDLRS